MPCVSCIESSRSIFAPSTFCYIMSKASTLTRGNVCTPELSSTITMSVSNKDIALSIIHFLKNSVATKEIPEDYAESMDVAIDCIADAFEVEKDDDAKAVETTFKGLPLSALVSSGLSSGAASATATSKSATATTGSSATAATTEVQPSAEDQEKADKLKLEGNRAMASKNFLEAVTKYTEAIKLNPTNVVYLSNRAAAYSQSSQHAKAVEDSEAAIKLNPKFSKAYSRLGLAKYALGDAKGAMEAYKQGLDIEGDSKSDAMTKGYETAKRRVEEELETGLSSAGADRGVPSEDSSAGAGAGGMPDFSSMFGGAGGAGGMPNFADMMKNPQLMQAAQELMSNPAALQGLMNNPMLKNMAQSMGMGGGEGGEGAPDLSEMMNNPMLRNMANQFMGGNNGGSGAGSGSS